MQRWANLWKPILGLLLLLATIASGVDAFAGGGSILLKRPHLSPAAVATSSFAFAALCVVDLLFLVLLLRGKRL